MMMQTDWSNSGKGYLKIWSRGVAVSVVSATLSQSAFHFRTMSFNSPQRKLPSSAHSLWIQNTQAWVFWIHKECAELGSFLWGELKLIVLK